MNYLAEHRHDNFDVIACRIAVSPPNTVSEVKINGTAIGRARNPSRKYGLALLACFSYYQATVLLHESRSILHVNWSNVASRPR